MRNNIEKFESTIGEEKKMISLNEIFLREPWKGNLPLRTKEEGYIWVSKEEENLNNLYKERIGLDEENLNKVREKILSFLEEAHAEGKLKEFDLAKMETYIPMIAVCERILGEEFQGRTILEIGPGERGQVALDYFASKGAQVMGIDNNTELENLSEKVELIKDKDGLIRLDKHLGNKKVDILYFVHLGPTVDRMIHLQDEHIKQIDNAIKISGYCITTQLCDKLGSLNDIGVNMVYAEKGSSGSEKYIGARFSCPYNPNEKDSDSSGYERVVSEGIGIYQKVE